MNTIAANGNAYTYDFENHLTSFNSSSVTYVYDGDGNRIAKTVGGVTTNYLVDTNNPTGHSQVVDELVNNQVVRTFAYGCNLLEQRQNLNGTWITSFYGFDGQSSVRLLADAGGNLTDTYTYDAFGNLIASTGNTPNDRLYTGEKYDANIGFYNLRSRYMRPDIGRFLTMDSFEGNNNDPISLHKYLYADANPVNRIDPDGYLSNRIIGMAVHKYLKADFVGRNPVSRDGEIGITTILQRRGATLGPLALPGFLLRTDLVEFGIDPGTELRSIYEIKTLLGKPAGYVQMYTYLGLLNGYDPGWGPGSR